ncbi:HEAT repeat domain-containing protein [bacterium]|nr:HEAT repeat domain-containing protein [bacterium]
MKDKTTLIFVIKEVIERFQGNLVLLFSEIKSQNSKDELAQIYSWIIENSFDIPLLSQTIKEIDKLRNPENLDVLIDFLISKTNDKFITSKSEENDFINLKVLAVKVIGNFQDKKAVPALLYCLNSKSENYKIRLCIAEALGKIGDKGAVESLINVVKDESEKSVYVRESAAKALGMLGDLKAIEPFILVLQSKKTFLDKFTFLKEQIIEAIGKLNAPEDRRILEVLKDSLKDESAQVRLNAIESLSNSEYEEAGDLIQEMLFDEDDEVKKGAMISLYNMFGKSKIAEILEEVDNLPEVLAPLSSELLDMEEDEDE